MREREREYSGMKVNDGREYSKEMKVIKLQTMTSK